MHMYADNFEMSYTGGQYKTFEVPNFNGQIMHLLRICVKNFHGCSKNFLILVLAWKTLSYSSRATKP